VASLLHAFSPMLSILSLIMCCFSYFLVFGATENDVQIENIFVLTRKAYLIFRKLFLFLNIVNHFLSLSFSFLLAFSLIVFSLPLNSL
jgi:hypothetical protein